MAREHPLDRSITCFQCGYVATTREEKQGWYFVEGRSDRGPFEETFDRLCSADCLYEYAIRRLRGK